ncbi:4-hydroxythreonine-4-phosphate dehydrogenase PdxA [Aquisalimonas asiatica]|uniref:4-hydroxythreonine-4-phosphate dehydrogenase n=1 Tax=Aquisalimonas asiatica TaxID=406100 RepID=A0A1H8VCV5_9GAMM|nr:4-hydroxythreonine-4-phosphate dehydrogenase PdxA [Aquisalimonas asiatica]SEP13266.1 4-hydroxythreonine-4-phosphate dehydrogenase [Aquisalimonas asiatica]
MTQRPPVIALTVGEPAGIGPDLVVTLAARGELGDVVAVGDPDVLRERAGSLGIGPIDIHLLPTPDTPLRPGALNVLPVPVANPVTPGTLDPANGASVVEMLRLAGTGAHRGDFAAVVTAPVQKSVINAAGLPFSGHTEYFAELTGAPMPVMMLAAGDLRVALVTTHLPLRDVADAITADRLRTICTILDHDLRQVFGLSTPRILVCGLNPHAGEDGHLGREEIEIITPTLDALRHQGIDLHGPLPADTLFTPEHLTGADAVLAMYHDQGLPVLKHAGFGEAVNITLGLPIIRTSVDHGTALPLAGSGRARTGSLSAALDSARDMVRRARHAADRTLA